MQFYRHVDAKELQSWALADVKYVMESAGYFSFM